MTITAIHERQKCTVTVDQIYSACIKPTNFYGILSLFHPRTDSPEEKLI